MQLLIVSGFLGTGKTTFIIKFVKSALQKGVKIAILVNEVGEIGIDDQLMRRLGLNVWEILGGCICCTLAVNLNETLDKLLQEYKPKYKAYDVLDENKRIIFVSTYDNSRRIGLNEFFTKRSYRNFEFFLKNVDH